jgi:hypothetical protein
MPDRRLKSAYRTATEDLAGLSDALPSWLLVLDPQAPTAAP